MKNFLKKHIFAPPTHFDANTAFVMICGLAVIFSPIISCGPSKAELEERHKRVVEATNNPYETPIQEESTPSNEEIIYEDIEIRVIDSCEYIVWLQTHYNAGNIIHKSNCRNPIHKN